MHSGIFFLTLYDYQSSVLIWVGFPVLFFLVSPGLIFVWFRSLVLLSRIAVCISKGEHLGLVRVQVSTGVSLSTLEVALFEFA